MSTFAFVSKAALAGVLGYGVYRLVDAHAVAKGVSEGASERLAEINDVDFAKHLRKNARDIVRDIVRGEPGLSVIDEILVAGGAVHGAEEFLKQVEDHYNQ